MADELTEVECCPKRIGMLPGVGAPVTIHTADCPRLDDIVMRAFLLGDPDPFTEDMKALPDQALRTKLWSLRHQWLTRALNQTEATQEGVSVGLGDAARDLRTVLEAHGG